MKSKISILVCAHKEDSNTRNSGIYKAIHGGKALKPELDLGFQGDNEGDNISEKNPFWSELTVLYWGWKNLKNIEYCGLNHYRRYFDLDINENNIDKIIDGYDMIVVKSPLMYSNHERAKNLMHITSIEDYYIFADTFLYMYPEYKKEFIEYFYNSRKSYPFQMFIAKKEIYDDYCNFMFPVLFEIEKRIKPHGYTRQKRTIGYMGEWFLGLYIYCKKLKVKPVLVKDYSSPYIFNLKKIVLTPLMHFAYSINNFFYTKPNDIYVPEGIKVGFKSDNISLKALK